MSKEWMLSGPVDSLNQSGGKKCDIKTLADNVLLLRGEQIKQQGCESMLRENACYVLIARA